VKIGSVAATYVLTFKVLKKCVIRLNWSVFISYKRNLITDMYYDNMYSNQ